MMHMLVAISLLGIFMLSASQLFVTIQRTVSKTQGALTIINQSRTMQRTLRRDVWAASKIEVQEKQSVHLKFSDESSITWRFGELAVSRKSDDDSDARQWKVGDVNGSFEVRGPTLLVRLSPIDHSAPLEMNLTSQQLLVESLTEEGADQ